MILDGVGHMMTDLDIPEPFVADTKFKEQHKMIDKLCKDLIELSRVILTLDQRVQNLETRLNSKEGCNAS